MGDGHARSDPAPHRHGQKKNQKPPHPCLPHPTPPSGDDRRGYVTVGPGEM